MPHALSLKGLERGRTCHSRPNKFVLFGGAFNGSPTINVQCHQENDSLRMMDNLLGYEQGKRSSLFYASYHCIQMFTQLPRPS